MPVPTTSPRTRFTSPLHGILHISRPWYIYFYGPVSLPPSQFSRANCLFTKPPVAASDLTPQSLSSALPASLVTVFDPVRPTIFDFIRVDFFYYLFVFPVWLDSIIFSIRLDLIFPIQFDSRLTYLFSIWVTKSGYYYSQASGCPTLARVSSK